MDRTKPTVTRIVSIDPDLLIDVIHRMKQAAFDECYPGESILMPLTDEITLSYSPAKEFCKPLHTSGSNARIGSEFLDSALLS